MENIRKLRRQTRTPFLVCMIVMDVSMALLVVLLFAFSSWDEIVYRIQTDIMEVGGILFVLPTAVAVCNIDIVRRILSWHPSLKNLPPEIRAAVNEQCMTGMICGNGILCEDGYLLVADRELKVAEPGELAWIDERKALFGRAKSLWVMTHRHQWLVISSLGRRLRGNGTFRPVDIDTFRRALEKVIFGDSVRSDEAEKPSEVLFQGTNVETTGTAFQGTNEETLRKDSEEE